MKEKPIIFSGEMVKAILEGRKTQTRRVIKPTKKTEWLLCSGWDDSYIKDPGNFLLEQCPFGQVGDRLWVRETFVIESDAEYGYSEDEIKRLGEDRPIKEEIGDGAYYHLIPHYRATEPEPNIVPPSADDFDDKTRWSPTIFMPRWASRITLEITEVRVERLQEISSIDAKTEGAKWESYRKEGELHSYSHIDGFINLWDSLNVKRGYGWDTNPWVWVIGFKVAK